MDSKRIESALWTTWEAIADDIIECNGGKSMHANEVIETVLDSSYLDMYGNLDSDELMEFKSLTYQERINIAKKVFNSSLRY